MFDPQNTVGLNPYCIKHEENDQPENVDLINLAPAINRKYYAEQEKEVDYGTTRVIRVYRQTGRSLEQAQRIDWEIPAPVNQDGEFEWIQKPEQLEEINKKLDKLDEKEPVDAIVIKDLRKGVVSSVIIESLAKRYPNAPWFISSKAWLPDWLDKLRGLSVHLLLIPSISAHRAVLEGAVNTWITRKGIPSKESIDVIEKLRLRLLQKEKEDKLRIIVLPEGHSAMAVDKTRTVKSQPTNGAKNQPINEAKNVVYVQPELVLQPVPSSQELVVPVEYGECLFRSADHLFVAGK